MAAEKLNRRWVGIDIWDGAHDVTISRLKNEGFLTGPDDSRPDILTSEGQITYTKEPPSRTDDGEYAVPYLQTVSRTRKESAPKMTRAQMLERLVDKDGIMCQGCYREFDDKRYLELDHNLPRSDGGGNGIENRVLLCGPCNKAKSNKLTLSGLRQWNKKHNFMQAKPTGKTGAKPRPRQGHLSSYD